MDPEYIVAEVSKNWPEHPASFAYGKPISKLFEGVIGVNGRRGYTLHSFTLHQLLTGPGEMTETIIAVFRRTPGGGELLSEVR